MLSNHLLDIVLAIVLLGTVAVGVYVSHRISKETKLIIRLILLLPMFMSVININLLVLYNYPVTILDIMRELSILVLYILIGALLKGNRLLKNIDTICNRELKLKD